MSDSNGIKILTDNRRARHEYSLSEHLETGMVLTGSEVKAARAGKIQLSDSYGTIRRGELWLQNAHISHYGPANRENHEPIRPRKLLAHAREIEKMSAKIRDGGLTLIPTKIYLKKGLVKCELALAKVKKIHDKRATERKREAESEARTAVREHRR